MSLPLKYDITKYKGETLLQNFMLRDKYDNPLDLTGFTAKMQVRLSVNDGDDAENPLDPIFELTTENGGILIDPDSGSITLYVDRLEAPLNGVYDVFIFDTQGSSTLFISPKSKFRVLESVTNV